MGGGGVGVGRCGREGERGERSGGILVNCTDRCCEKTYNGLLQTHRKRGRGRERGRKREVLKKPRPWSIVQGAGCCLYTGPSLQALIMLLRPGSSSRNAFATRASCKKGVYFTKTFIFMKSVHFFPVFYLPAGKKN